MKTLLFALLTLTISICYGQKHDSLKVDNVFVHYYTYGEGEPILILSGGPGNASAQESITGERLGKIFKAILLDQRGTGRTVVSRLDSSTINYQLLINDIEALRKFMGIKKWNLYGHSWGAMLAGLYIARYPDQVKTFISIGGGELDASITKSVTSNINDRFGMSKHPGYAYWSDSAVYSKNLEKAMYEIRRLSTFPLVYDTTKIDSYMPQIAKGVRDWNVNSLYWQSVKGKLTINKPIAGYMGATLLFTGLNDPVGLTTLPSYLKIFPNAEVATLPECGHFPDIEKTDSFFPIITAFLQKHAKPAVVKVKSL